MKRLSVIIISLMILANTFAQTQSFSRWSITPEVGINYLAGNLQKVGYSLWPTSLNEVTYGLNLEYALSPIWGISVDGYFFPIRQKRDPLQLNTQLYTGDLQGTVNITRLFFPHSKSKVYVLGSVGLGYASYNYDVRFSDGTPVNSGDTYMQGGKINTVYTYSGNKAALSFPLTLALEYNFSRPLAVGTKLQYRAFTKDNLEGVQKFDGDGVTNDFMGAATLFLRYKFRATSKEHMRNVTMDKYDPDKGLELAMKLDDRLKKLETKVDKIDATVDSMRPKLAKLEQMLSTDGPDFDGDGVPDARDKDNSTKPNTPVDFWGREVPADVYSAGKTNPTTGLRNEKVAGNRAAVYVPDEVPSLYFGFDKITLDDDALTVISKIADRMKKDATLMVEIRGYCDYSGNTPYNTQLSQRRADRVKEELVKVWGIATERIIANGKGKVIEPRLKYRPSRRCDFYFAKL